MDDHRITSLRKRVLAANLALVEHGLVRLTFGNASACDRELGLVAIKPSGVCYCDLAADNMVVLDLQGRVRSGNLRPSSDTPTHLALYRAWPRVGGVVHTHSPAATAFAQAGREIPCLGTTHADVFHGPVPLTRMLTPTEVETAYEANTGRVIVQRLGAIPPLELPGALVAGHGPCAWGRDAAAAVEHAVMLEEVARMALDTLRLAPEAGPLPEHVQEKHFARKHGPGAYYGQTGDRDAPAQ